jgi:lipopolysaccharide export system permease protein
MLFPLIWRYLGFSYLRLFFLSVGAFLATLFVLRFKEIARFTALSGDWGQTALFTVYQFPLILPIAIPISTFLASYLLVQKMSHTSELLAFRACGLNFSTLFAPLWTAALFLTLLHFSLSADIAPYCRRKTKMMLSKNTTGNPLLLLQRQKLMKLKHAYLSMDLQEGGEQAQDLLLILYNNKSDRLNLFWAPSLCLKDKQLIASSSAFLSHLPRSEREFDALFLENQNQLITNAHILAPYLKKTVSHCETVALPFRMLLLSTKKFAFVELLRRCSLSLSVLSCTLLGCAFGIELGRIAKKTPLIPLVLLLFLLMSTLIAKSLKASPVLAFLSLLIPHLFIGFLSFLRFRGIHRGIL